MQLPQVDPAPMHPCAHCATLQKTCCQTAEILVTSGDLARISRHTGLAPDEGRFWERRVPVDPEYLDDDADDPNWKRWTVAPDNTRRVLRKQKNGDCMFLGQRGCILPENVRPIVCRLYPFSYTESGIQGEDAGYCPKRAVAPEAPDMVTALGMTLDAAERWHAALYDELRTGRESACGSV